MTPMSVLGHGRRRAEDGAKGTARLTDLVLITGYSGAGKSSAMQFFEDAGYFCVDNLPPGMIRSLAELFMHEGSKVEHAAGVSDARGGEYFESLLEVAEQLRGAGVNLRILFLEADEQTLITRYKETRRRHPLANSGSVVEGIAAERPLVAPLRERADFVLDTSGLRPSHLRHRLAEEMLPARSPSRLALTFNSFGHKHGPLRDAPLAPRAGRGDAAGPQPDPAAPALQLVRAQARPAARRRPRPRRPLSPKPPLRRQAPPPHGARPAHRRLRQPRRRARGVLRPPVPAARLPPAPVRA